MGESRRLLMSVDSNGETLSPTKQVALSHSSSERPIVIDKRPLSGLKKSLSAVDSATNSLLPQRENRLSSDI